MVTRAPLERYLALGVFISGFARFDYLLSALHSGMLHCADEVAGPIQLLKPTSDKGRLIDYAVHSADLVPVAREQHKGVADHDLVIYAFPTLATEPALQVAPARALRATEPVTQVTWSSCFPQQQFQTCLDSDCVQDAWNLLSNSCEQMLDPGQGRPRAKVPRPTVAASAPVKQHALQSVRERRLRRTLRRLEELGKPQAPWRIVPKVRAELDKLQRSYPELSEFAVGDPELLQVLEMCICKEREAAQQERLQRWRARMDEDDKALVRWVKGSNLLPC